MLRKLVLSVVFVVLSVSTVNAAGQIYGVGSLNIPTETKGQYTWDRLRLGVDAPMTTEVSGHLLVDVSKSAADVKFGYVDVRRGHFTANVGKWLAPAQFCFDPAGTIQLPDWSYSNRHFTAFGLGGRVDVANGPVFVSVGHNNDGVDSRLSSIVTVAGKDTTGYDRSAALSVYAEGHVGYGAYARLTVSRWLNPSFGGSTYSQNTTRGTASGETYVFFQNYVQVLSSLRLYGQYDVTNRDNLPDRGLVGLAWEYAPRSFVRVYYDTAMEEWRPSVSFVYAITAL